MFMFLKKIHLWSSMWLSPESYSSAANIAKSTSNPAAGVISIQWHFFSKSHHLCCVTPLWLSLTLQKSSIWHLCWRRPELILWLAGPSAVCTDQKANGILVMYLQNGRTPAGICGHSWSPEKSPNPYKPNKPVCGDTDGLTKTAKHDPY